MKHVRHVTSIYLLSDVMLLYINYYYYFVCFSLRFRLGDIVLSYCHNPFCDDDCLVLIINLFKSTYAFVSSSLE